MALRSLSLSIVAQLESPELEELAYILKDNFTENQLVELKTGENIAKILEKGKVSQKIRNAQFFQDSLEAIGRNDLGKKLDQFIYPVSEEHRNEYDGYSVITHIPHEDLIANIFPTLYEKNKDNIRILLKNEGKFYDKHEFGEYCKNKYYKKHFETIMLQRVFTLPDVALGESIGNPILQAPFDIILKTMENWCGKYQEEGNIKGLVVFGYSLDDHLKFLKYPDDILKTHLYNKTSADFQETVTVYNPQKRLIFLVRRAKDKKDLEDEMKCSIDDALKFVFLYNDILKNSGIKLINLLVTDTDVDCIRWKCKFCKHQLISMNSLNSCASFQEWLQKKECHFETDFDPTNKNNTFSLDFSAKLLGFLASFQFSKEYHFHWRLPSLAKNPATQMAETTILLTLEQLRIVNSPNKHIMIQGCYGSGKSLIALKKAEMTSKSLKQNELLYFVSYDSSSMLTTDIVSTSNIKLYRNESALKLSEIINNIKKDNPKHNINLIVDEYDAEHLNKLEAEKLNQIFTKDEKLRDSIVYLVFEALQRKRTVNGSRQIANQLALLRSMEFRELTWNKRNTLQIHNLVKVTTDALKNQTTTVFIPTYNEQDSKIQLGLEKAKVQKKGEALGQGSPVQHPGKEKDDDNNMRKNVNKKKFTFDEASKYYSSPINPYLKVKSKEVKTTFQHRKSKHSGHSIESETPNLYEIYRPKGNPVVPEFILSLIVVLEQVIGKDYENIKKQVILHFDVEKDIPSIFYMAFKMMGILEKVTNKYVEFKKENGRKIFIGNFRAFRGLEYPRVVVVLDDNVRGLEQYLPECLNRCTTDLHAILLRENTHILRQAQNKGITLQNIITTWKKQSKSERLVNSWIVHIFGSGKNKVSEKFYEKRDPGIIKIYSTSGKYRELKAHYKKLQFFQNEDTNNEEIIREEMESAVKRIIGASGSGPETDRELIESFLDAARDGDVTTVVRMLKDGMPVDVNGMFGWTALHKATRYNRIDVIKILLLEGADVNKQADFKDTPLHFAAQFNKTEVARLLIQNGADVNIRNDLNETPLDYAHKGSEVERLLLQHQ